MEIEEEGISHSVAKRSWGGVQVSLRDVGRGSVRETPVSTIYTCYARAKGIKTVHHPENDHLLSKKRFSRGVISQIREHITSLGDESPPSALPESVLFTFIIGVKDERLDVLKDDVIGLIDSDTPGELPIVGGGPVPNDVLAHREQLAGGRAVSRVRRHLKSIRLRGLKRYSNFTQ